MTKTHKKRSAWWLIPQILVVFGINSFAMFLDVFKFVESDNVPFWFGVAAFLTAAIFIPMTYQMRKGERRLRATAEEFKLILETVDESVVVVETDGTVRMMNHQAEALLGMQSKLAIGWPIEQVASKLYASAGVVEPPVYQAMREDRSISSAQVMILPGEEDANEPQWIGDNASPIHDVFGRVTGCVLVFRNITEEYKRREQLQTRNALLQNASELAGMAYFYCDEAGKAVRLYESVSAKYWGYYEDGRPMGPSKWILPEDLPAFEEAWRKLVAKESSSLDIVYRARVNGDVHNFQMRVNRAILASSKAFSYLGVVQDITTLTQNRQKYQDTDSLLRAILDQLPCYLFLKDVSDDYRYTMCNAQFADIVGRTPATVVGRTDYDIFLEREDAEHFRADDIRVIESNENLNYTEKYTHSDGSLRYGLIIKRIFTGTDGKKFLLGMGMDVTQERMAEEARLENYAILQAVSDSLPGLFVIKDPAADFRVIAWNKIAALFTGVPAEMILGRPESEVMPPEVAAAILRDDQAAMNAEGIYEVIEDLPSAGPNPVVRTIHTFKKKVAAGNRELLIVLSIDITEQHRLERRQKTLVDRLKGYTRQERVINTCIRTLLSESSTSDSLASIMELVAAEAGASAAFVFRYEADTNTLVPNIRWAAPGSELLLPPEDAEFALPDGALGEMQKLRAPIFVDNPSAPDLSLLQRMLITFSPAGTLVAAPVWNGNEFWGLTGVMTLHPGVDFSLLTPRLIQSISHVVGISMERRTQEEERRLILDAMKIPIVLLDKELRVVRVNNSAATLFHGLESRLIGACSGFCLQKTCLNLTSCPARTSVDTLREYETDIEYEGRTYNLLLSPIIAKGRLRNILASYVDTTDLVQGQKRLEVALEAARKADRTKSHFLSTMSHELRTPLNAVIGYSELMQDEALPREQQIENLKTIHFAANTLLKLINDILDLSKLESEQFQIVSEMLDLVPILNEVVRIAQPRARQNGTTIAVHMPEHMPLFKFDQMRIRQILLNIIGNAVKFTHHGSIDVTVSFTPVPKHPGFASLVIAVKDTGPGVTPEFQKRIFEPFKQDDRIRGNRVFEGSGLGLAISQRLATRMGGEITLESELGKGATFSFVLPAVECSEEEAKSKLPQKVAIEAIKADGHVLLVDDVPMNLQVLGAMLQRLGLAYESASSAFEALEAVKRKLPAIVLTDLWMPEMNGDELAKALKDDPVTAALPVVAVTADTQLAQGQVSVFDDILYKPITLKSLADILRARLPE